MWRCPNANIIWFGQRSRIHFFANISKQEQINNRRFLALRTFAVGVNGLIDLLLVMFDTKCELWTLIFCIFSVKRTSWGSLFGEKTLRSMNWSHSSWFFKSRVYVGDYCSCSSLNVSQHCVVKHLLRTSEDEKIRRWPLRFWCLDDSVYSLLSCPAAVHLRRVRPLTAKPFSFLFCNILLFFMSVNSSYHSKMLSSLLMQRNIHLHLLTLNGDYNINHQWS